MAIYQHTTGFTRGEVDESLYDRVDVDFYRAASKHMENWFPDLAGSIRRRPALNFYTPAVTDYEYKDHLILTFSFMQYDILIRFAYRTEENTETIHYLDVFTYYINQEDEGSLQTGDDKTIEIKEPTGPLSRSIHVTSVGPSAFVTSRLFPPQRVFYSSADDDVLVEEVVWYRELVGSITHQTYEEYAALADEATHQRYDIIRRDGTLYMSNRVQYITEWDSDGWDELTTSDNAKYLIYGDETLFTTQVAPGDYLKIKGQDYEVDDVLNSQALLLSEEIDFPESFTEERIGKRMTDPFDGDYPALCTFHRGRLFLFSTDKNPVKMWASKAQDPFTIFPGSVHEDAPIEYELLAEGADEFKWVATGEDIYLGGSRAEYIVAAPGESPITPTNFAFRKIADLGGDSTQPVTSDASIMFVSRSRSQIFAVAYDFQRAGFTSSDVSMLAPHLVKGRVREMAFRSATRLDRSPRIILINDDNSVRTVAISEEQNVIAWSRISIAEGLEIVSVAATANDFYFLVRDSKDDRTYIASLDKTEDVYYTMDAYAFYDIPTNKEIEVEYIHRDRTVAVISTERGFLGYKETDGAILDLSDEGEDLGEVIVGLPYISRLELLPTFFEAQGGAMLNRKRRMIRAVISARDTYQLYVNDEPLFGILAERLGRELSPRTGIFEKRMLGWYTQDNVTIESASIYRATILSVTREVNA